MKYNATYYYKDNTMSLIITDTPKEFLKDRMLTNAIEARFIKGAQIGDIIEIEYEGNMFSGQKVLEIHNFDAKTRLENLKKAYFHFLDNADCGSYDLTKTVSVIDDEIFPDITISGECYLILKGVKTTIAKGLKLGELAQTIEIKAQQKKIKEIIKNYDEIRTNLFGITFEDEGYWLRDTPKVVPYYKNKYGLEKATTREVLDVVHEKTLETMYNLGNEAFGTNYQMER